MAIIKCKMCGGDIELSPDKTFGTCEYCGSTMTFPKIDDEHRAEAFNRGNHFRRIGEFDKALTVYERIVQEDSADAEAHWCCALCRFGIEYVKDPASGEYLPTCHRASFDSFLEDVDCRAALEHADAVTREQYRKDAKQIAAVQRRIMSTVQKEAPFDVFICYKETGADGSRTVDSTLAQDIYYRLTEEGRRVFFARITLEDKAGQEYEPYIFAALHSAKVMLVVGTKPEHFNAVWVKNEWSRYLALMKNDRKRLLIPCYRDMDPYDLPEQLAVLQSYDMGRIGFIQDLIRGVSKVLGVEKAKPEAAKETVVVQSESSGNLTALLKRGNMALEDGEWDKADGFFEQVLNLDAECAEAYFGKALAVRKCSDAKQFISREKNAATRMRGALLAACPVDEEYITQTVKNFQIHLFLTEETIRAEFEKFDRTYESMEDARRQEFRREQNALAGDKLFSKAVRYAKDGQAVQAQKEILDAYQSQIDTGRKQDKEQAEKVSREYAEFLKKTRHEVEKLHNKTLEELLANYNDAVKDQERAAADGNGGVEEKRTAAILFRAAAENFRSFGPYKDSPARTKMCDKEADRLENDVKELEEQEKERKLRLEEKLARQRKARNKKITAIAAAVTVLAVSAWLVTTKVIIPGNRYKAAEECLAAGKYGEAIDVFAALGDYKDSVEHLSEAFYMQADSFLEDGNNRAAAVFFGKAGKYKEAQAKSAELWKACVVRETISAGYNHMVGLKADGSVVAVGDNEYGQYNVSDWTDIVAISAGYNHTVGLKADGSVVAVGYNKFGQCYVSDWADIVAISAGDDHTVDLKADGSVVTVGYNRFGQYNVSDWTDIVAISAGNDYTVGLKADGSVVTVGYNRFGQYNVSDWTDIVAISAGNDYTVGLKADGSVVAIGDNIFGQCDVSDWTDIVAISAGDDHTVGLKADGSVVAVGDNEYGQCNVSDWTDIVAISAGDDYTVGLKADGSVVAVGDNGDGRCNVSSWTDIVAISAGEKHTVGLKADGTVVAVGETRFDRCNVSGWKDIKLP